MTFDGAAVLNLSIDRNSVPIRIYEHFVDNICYHAINKPAHFIKIRNKSCLYLIKNRTPEPFLVLIIVFTRK